MSENENSRLSTGELDVLGEFGAFLMTPGKMLCFSGPQLDKFAVSLDQLVVRGMLDAENRHGGYSLTKAGFTAMMHHRSYLAKQCRNRRPSTSG